MLFKDFFFVTLRNKIHLTKKKKKKKKKNKAETKNWNKCCLKTFFCDTSQQNPLNPPQKVTVFRLLALAVENSLN